MGPEVPETIPGSLRGGQCWLELGSPAESGGGLQKRKPQPSRGCQGGEGAAGGKAPGEEPAHPRKGLSHPVLGSPRPSWRRLRTLSGYCARSARLDPPPSCCIANKILMSPLPLPLGRLLRSARGAGSSASRAGRGSPVRSRPRLRGLPASLAAARALPAPLPASRRQPLPRLSAGPPGELRKGGPARRELVPAPQDPLGLGVEGAALLLRPRAPPGAPSLLPSFLFPPPLLARRPPLRFPFTLSAVYCLSSPLPLAWPSAWVFPHFL